MNFDKFKSVLPKKAQIDNKDVEYLQYLDGLKEPQQSNIWAVVGTIAAAVLIVLAVGLWAIIGRGIRGTEPVTTPPASEDFATEDFDYIKVTQLSKEYDLTEKNLEKFENALFSHFNITRIPFLEPNSTPPTNQQIANYYYTIKTELDLEDFAKEYFNIESDFKDVLPSGDTYTADADYKVLTIREVKLNDGRRVISVLYEMEGYVYTLSYFALGDAGIEVDYFWSHQKNGPSGDEGETVEKLEVSDTPTDSSEVYVHKVASEYKEYIYKISGSDASELSQLLSTDGKTNEGDGCICFPTHRIIINDVSYDIVLGDAFCSHFTNKAAKSKYRFTTEQQKRLTQLFEKCLVEENKEREKQLTPEVTTEEKVITVTVKDDLAPQLNGTYTITGEDAESIIYSLKKKQYANDTAKFLPSIELTVGQNTYYLHTGENPFVRTSCGQYPLENDSAIIVWVEKYIGSSWTKDGNGWYETDDGYYVTNDYGKTFEKYITRKKAVLIANAEAMNKKYNYQPWSSDFYIDENSKDVKLTHADNIWWEKEWQTEYYREGAPCWEVRLFDYNDVLTSLILYIDAKTGKVIGGKQLSD